MGWYVEYIVARGSEFFDAVRARDHVAGLEIYREGDSWNVMQSSPRAHFHVMTGSAASLCTSMEVEYGHYLRLRHTELMKKKIVVMDDLVVGLFAGSMIYRIDEIVREQWEGRGGWERWMNDADEFAAFVRWLEQEKVREPDCIESL